MTAERRLQLIKHLKQNRFLIGLNVMAAVLAIAAIGFSWAASGWIRDILMNIGFLLLSVVITYAIVEYVIVRHEAQPWIPYREKADWRLRRHAANFIEALRSVCFLSSGPDEFQIPRWQVSEDLKDWQLTLLANPDWIKVIREALLTKTNFQHTIDIRDAERLIQELNLLTENLRNHVQLYGQTLRPEIANAVINILDDAPIQLGKVAIHIKMRGVVNENLPGIDLTAIARNCIEIILEVNQRQPPKPTAYVDEEP